MVQALSARLLQIRPLNIKIKHVLECLCVAALLGTGLHFISERMTHREMPLGDEGSWLSVAAEVSRGHGFSTHWLEYQFQKPYTLPRPDDFRFPGLTVLLSMVFDVAGISYQNALRTCAFFFVCFCLAVFIAVRKAFGPASALISLSAITFSLDQLQWNSLVYTEGLFGLVLAGIVYLSITLDDQKKWWWIAAGAGIGVLALVRPNGVLLAAGLLWQYLRKRGKCAIPLRYPVYGLLILIIVMLPWFVRNTLYFGNPLHIAGGAGLLQRSFHEQPNESFFSFIRTAGVLFPIKATIIGFPRFFKDLNFFEHGLCIPLVGFAALGCLQRRNFFSPCIAAGLCVTFIICCYASYKSYAGVRYFTAFLPFVYAYGIHTVVSLVKRFPLCAKRFYIAYPAYALIAACFLAPVFYPHRYYERRYATFPKSTFDFSDHFGRLGNLLSKNDAYCAGKLAQLNFLSEYNCVGIQEDFDSSKVHTALAVFKPKALAISTEELGQERFRSFIENCIRNDCIVSREAVTARGVYFSLKYPEKLEH